MREETTDAARDRGVLWDLDGTLVDSAELHWISWRDTLAAEGHQVSYQQFLDSFGQKNDRILPSWLGRDTPAERMARIGDEKEAAYRRLARARGLTPLPGSADWVRRLRAAGWKQAIASSAPRENVEVMLQALGLAAEFDARVGAEDVTAGKPDPQVFLAAAAKLGLPPDRCVVVEDAAVGIEAARRAGIRAIGVSTAAALNADIVVRSLADLPLDAFDRLMPR
jgi:HAD superfamily hydrolase (TIGR01509 family)